MTRYTQDSRERVREAVDFVALVSAKTDLRRAGVNRYEGLCPFHDERTPSFGIKPSDKVYYCFGCQASGDVFNFVQETEGVDFPGALELLADRFGVELERESEDPREAELRRRRERLLELLARTTAYYVRVLWEGAEAERARTYLSGRGLGQEVLREFAVGYAPSPWDRVLLASRRAGFSEKELYAVGLAQRSQQTGRPYDRFRERIVFPLADVRGRVLGFGARAMRDNQQPKYLNTSDNDVYHKGRHLYGAHLARAHAARAGRVIVCEGYTDVIALHQAGLRETVGLMGTALTAEQVSELARMAGSVLLALDADSAGQEAMLRAARLAAAKKLELRVVVLAPGADPAEMVQREGVEAMSAAVEASVPFVRFQVERVLESGDHGSPEGKDRMIAELRPLFSSDALPPGAMREELTRTVSGRLGLREGLTESLLSSGGGRGLAQSASGSARAAPPRALDRREQAERSFLASCIAIPEHGRTALEDVDIEEHFTSDVVRRGALHLRSHLDAPGEGLPDDDPELKGLIAELAVRAAGESPRPATLEVESLQLEIARVERQIQSARAAGRGEVLELAMRRGELKQAMDRAYEKVLEAGEG